MRNVFCFKPLIFRAALQWLRPGSWRNYCRNSSGAALLEFAFLTPILMLLVTGIIQFGALFFLENNMVSIARDTARRLAVGDLTTKAEAETHAEDSLVNWGADFDVIVTLPNPPTTYDYVVQISVPMADASIVDPFGLMGSGNLTAQSTMRQEQ